MPRLPIPFMPRKIDDIDPEDPKTRAWVDEILGRLAGPAASWEPVTRDEVRQLARLCGQLLDRG